MFKPMLVLIALTATTACMNTEGATQVSRNHTGHVSSCPGLTGVSAQYSQPVAGLPVRCGPQSASPYTRQ
ncbi:hypothetical protein FHS72_002021 [Loktanella ponticola]|uniref:Lipoprotein n=1 Tax=Yoonia ponticola TaxID=1524255 RepID=A0A7W9EZP6_9RHOB|nr:hypothetical protein [Yoonia ponticola]